MTIETKHNIGDKLPIHLENAEAAFVILAVNVRVNSPGDTRVVYEGKLYQHTTDVNGQFIRWGASRPFSFSEREL